MKEGFTKIVARLPMSGMVGAGGHVSNNTHARDRRLELHPTVMTSVTQMVERGKAPVISMGVLTLWAVELPAL